MSQSTRIFRPAALAVAALAVVVSGNLWASNPLTPAPQVAAPPAGDVNFYLNGLGAGNILAGVYTSPYGALIDATNISSSGAATGGTSIPVICDDFISDTYLYEDWYAVVTNLSTLSSGVNTKLRWGTSNSVTVNDTTQASGLGSSYGVNQTLTQLQAYNAAALLAINILNIPDTQAYATALNDYSFAMWALFETGPALAQLSGAGAMAQEKNAIQYLHDAVTAAQDSTAVAGLLSNYNVTIYSYDTAANFIPACYAGPTGCPSNSQPQEFITVAAVPEASSVATFGVYSLVGALGFLYLRKRGIFAANL